MVVVVAVSVTVVGVVVAAGESEPDRRRDVSQDTERSKLFVIRFWENGAGV